MFAGMQRIEIRHAINAQDHRLAIDDELFDPIFKRGFHYPRISLGPVVSVAGEQPDAITIANYDQAIAVILYFVKPIGTGWNKGFPGREARQIFSQHAG